MPVCLYVCMPVYLYACTSVYLYAGKPVCLYVVHVTGTHMAGIFTRVVRCGLVLRVPSARVGHAAMSPYELRGDARALSSCI